MGLKICTFVVWGPESGKTVHWVPWPDGATSSAVQLEKAKGCVLCSSSTVSRAVGWATQLPVLCLGSLFGRLNAIFCNGWSYELVYLPGQSGRTGLVLCLWSCLKLTYTPCSLAEWCHWFCSTDNHLCLLYSQLKHCWAKKFPGVLTRLSGQAGPGVTLTSEWGYELAPLPEFCVFLTFIYLESHTCTFLYQAFHGSKLCLWNSSMCCMHQIHYSLLSVVSHCMNM